MTGYISEARENDSQWFKDAIIYQLHVKTFQDSDGDGIGDFQGLTRKLDYLQDLGVTAVWLLPFCPSPLKDDGYDISDYMDIHSDYGTLRDFKRFLREAHKKDIRVITELVINHTSEQHAWFQRGRRSKPGSRWRNFYVWSDSPDRYSEARIIFQDFESSNWTWDPLAKAYYWHRFYAHQPDLNYDNPGAQKAMFRVLDFWLGMGVDGLRLDAIPYLFEREGTNCENLPETHEFLKRIRSHMDSRFQDRMFLGEANQWPEDAAAYFGEGDECQMAFHFPLMPRLFMALHMEDRFPILDILEQTPSIPDACQWALFLRNHDELTLEMVTDEERDYMYRVYAQDPRMRVNLGIRRRLAPLLGNHRKRIELMNGLLFSMPGTPTIYYGDEIGMGDNVYLGDRNGVRTPMQWSTDRNAGFSTANPQQLYLPVIIDPEYHYDVVNVEAHQKNRHSLLWWMKRLITLRKRFAALGRGDIEFLRPANPKILAFVRRHGEERVLVVANLSRFVQFVELDLSGFEGFVPVEAFGRTPFPRVEDTPYFLTLGPHSFYWFALVPEHLTKETAEVSPSNRDWPLLEGGRDLKESLKGPAAQALERLLPAYLRRCRWFGGKARRIKLVSLEEVIALPGDRSQAFLTLIRVEYMAGDAETYSLPLVLACGEEAERIAQEQPASVVAVLKSRGEEKGLIHDALENPAMCEDLVRGILLRRHRKGLQGELFCSSTRAFRSAYGRDIGPLEVSKVRAEQSNTSIRFGDRLILKLIRRLDPGINPHLEIGRFLTGKGFDHVPHIAGAMEYSKGRGERMTIAVLEHFVPNEGDAWTYTVDVLGRYFENILALRPDAGDAAVSPVFATESVRSSPPQEAFDLIGPYLESARLLGQRTAELHVALSGVTADAEFVPVPFTKLYQRALYQSMRTLTRKVFKTLAQQTETLPAGTLQELPPLPGMEKEILARFKAVPERKLSGMRIRCHGDYHLGQVLHTGKDFVIIDFEGEPARPISERRIKRSPLKDVAGMLRSFHYAAHSALIAQEAAGLSRPEDAAYLDSWAMFWYFWVSSAFLGAYLEHASPGGFLPKSGEELSLVLEAYLLEKSVYELGYELNNRPEWAKIPLKGILHLLGGRKPPGE